MSKWLKPIFYFLKDTLAVSFFIACRLVRY